MRKTSSLLLVLAGLMLHAQAQDTSYIRSITDTLSSAYMAGRGYNDQGTLRAATFIMGELEACGAKPMGERYFQDFNLRINTIQGEVHCRVSDRELTPGEEFTVSSFSKGLDRNFEVYPIPKKAYKSWKKLLKFQNALIAEKGFDHMLLVDMKLAEDDSVKQLLRMAQFGPILSTGMIYLVDGTPGWHVSRAAEVLNYTVVNIKREAWDPKAESIHLSFRNRFYPSYPTQNVCAFIPGTEQPDSFVVFTAHYDHLGRMGDATWFPGTNDNASGTAMLLDLARYFSEHPAPYSIAFLFFSAEETGLKGSLEFAANPLIDLSTIRLLINLDMVGSGSEGITLVNGSVYGTEFDRIKAINDSMGYLPDVKARGESFNSDHAPFHAKGVPSFFIYTRGKEYKEYHTVDDDGPLPLTGYEGLFRLLVSTAQF